jgi:hypothetical protein
MAQLAFFAAMNILNFVVNLVWIWNPLLWIEIILAILYGLLNLFGFWGVYRLIPDWMSAYAYAVLGLYGLQIVSFIVKVLVGGLGYGLFNFLITVSIIWSFSCLDESDVFSCYVDGLLIVLVNFIPNHIRPS